MITEYKDIRQVKFPHQQGQPDYDVVAFNAILASIEALHEEGKLLIICTCGEELDFSLGGCPDCRYNLAYTLFLKIKPYRTVRMV